MEDQATFLGSRQKVFFFLLPTGDLDESIVFCANCAIQSFFSQFSTSSPQRHSLTPLL